MRSFTEVLTNPLAVASLLGLAGLVIGVWGRRLVARTLLWCALVVAYLGASPLVGNALVRPLEDSYPPLGVQPSATKVGYIAVLGSGYMPSGTLPITAVLDHDGLVRIVEGVRLMRHFDTPKLIVSGGALPGYAPPADGYAELARELGVADSALLILDKPRDTAAEAQTLRRTVGDEPFILVTSAYHMPRAMHLMRRAGMHPIAAPTGQLAIPMPLRWRDLLPDAGGLRRTEMALHEYLGLAVLAVQRR